MGGAALPGVGTGGGLCWGCTLKELGPGEGAGEGAGEGGMLLGS